MANVLYWDDQKRPIATSDAELLTYFRTLDGTISAANIPFLLPCPMIALIRVQSAGNLPKFIYKGSLSPSSRIFLQQLSANATDLGALCNGVNSNTLVPPPDVGTPVIQTIEVQSPLSKGQEALIPIADDGEILVQSPLTILDTLYYELWLQPQSTNPQWQQMFFDSPLALHQTVSPAGNTPCIAIYPLADNTGYNFKVRRFNSDNMPSAWVSGNFVTGNSNN